MTAGSTKSNVLSGLRIPYQLMLIIAAVFVVYYPVTFGDVSCIDDRDILSALHNARTFNFHDLFIPHMQGGVYYRPILTLSYHIDKYLHNLDPGFMHIGNISLHAINALLVFWLASQLIPNGKAGKSLVPLLSALLFGLHPIATEPVSWIAGRTDVLACTFVLLSANCIVRFKKVNAIGYVGLSALFMCLGFLTKEVALAFLPGAFLLVWNWEHPIRESVLGQERPSDVHQSRRQYLFFFLLSFGSILAFILLRHGAIITNESRIGATIQFMQRDKIQVFLVFLQTLGFYLKKILLPLPLNFTIRDVDPLYELLGVPVVVACFFVISKKNPLSALFITGIFLIIPSFVISLGQIAWTLYAERYIYLPTAFIVIPSVIFMSNIIEIKPSSLAKNKVSISIILLAVMAVVTFHRSTVWKDNLALLEDSVSKNPEFYYIRGEYAKELASRGDINNARIQFTIANDYNRTKKRLRYGNSLFQLRYWELPELGLAYLLAKENKIPQAIDAYERIIQASNGESVVALRNVLYLYGDVMRETKPGPASLKIKEKLSGYSCKLYEVSGEADVYYTLGKIFLAQGEREEAINYFQKAEDKFSADNKYKIISQKFIARLENE